MKNYFLWGPTVNPGRAALMRPRMEVITLPWQLNSSAQATLRHLGHVRTIDTMDRRLDALSQQASRPIFRVQRDTEAGTHWREIAPRFEEWLREKWAETLQSEDISPYLRLGEWQSSRKKKYMPYAFGHVNLGAPLLLGLEDARHPVWGPRWSAFSEANNIHTLEV